MKILNIILIGMLSIGPVSSFAADGLDRSRAANERVRELVQRQQEKKEQVRTEAQAAQSAERQGSNNSN